MTDTWKNTDEWLDAIYKRWKELAEVQPSQKDVVAWKSWDELMEVEVRQPAQEIHYRRIDILIKEQNEKRANQSCER